MRLPTGIYKSPYGFKAVVRVRPHPPKGRHFPHGTPLQEMTDWRRQMQRTLEASRPTAARATCGTVAADVETFLDKKQALASVKSLRSELAAWVALYGARRRWSLTKGQIEDARNHWIREQYSPKTINNRVLAWSRLCHYFDGRRAATPCDDLRPLPTAEGNPRKIAPDVIVTVARNLKKAGDPKTLARFLVLTSTGRRPSELMRATPETDMDWQTDRVWYVKTAKGGNATTLDLSDDMCVAIRYFIQAQAAGPFDTSTYAKALYAAGWPAVWSNVDRHGRLTIGKRKQNALRPYQARHSVAIALGETGIDFQDIGDWLGHKQLQTTRKIYTGKIPQRLQKASAALEGRLGYRKIVSFKRTPAAS